MKKKFESSIRMIFSITNIFLAVFGILIVSLASFLITEFSFFISMLHQDNLTDYNSSAVICVIGGVALFILGAIGLFSSAKSRYFIVSIIIYMVSLVVVGLLLLSAVPLSFVFYARMDSYLEEEFPKQFNISDSTYNINMLQHRLSCCGVITYTEYTVRTWDVPQTCECVKRKPNCTNVLQPISNMLFPVYTEGCQSRLKSTNQMQVLLGGITVGVLCIEICLLAVSPVLIYLNYK